jgi:hypothetical protein
MAAHLTRQNFDWNSVVSPPLTRHLRAFHRSCEVFNHLAVGGLLCSVYGLVAKNINSADIGPMPDE